MDNMSYEGFHTFTWLADRVGLPIDQLNFVLTQFAALILAAIFRWKLNPYIVSPNTRHAFGLFIGLALGYFCFGNKTIHIIGLPSLCYIATITLNPIYMQKVVLFIALAYLSCIHIHRQIYDYGSYSLDITGPLMVITQKVTSLAFSMHDGLTRKPEELTNLQKYQAINKKPTFLEYFSYMFHFQALMAGPVVFYRDYIDFVHGRHIQVTQSQNGNHSEKSKQVEDISSEPSPTLVVGKKVTGSLLCALIMISFIPLYPIRRIKDEEFLQNTSIFYKTWYIIMTTMLARFKYFFAWLFADAICNLSGLGFNGYDEKGKPKWDLVSNVDAFKFETAPNFREAVQAWNKGTNRWLRSLVYERATRYRTIYTYTLSAVWHGFYPGYYLTFANAALFTFAARAVRRHIRPYFLNSQISKLFYDAITIISTRILMAYITFTFVLLELQPSINMYLHMYLTPHLIGIAAITFLPLLPRSSHSAKMSKTSIEKKPLINNSHSSKIEEIKSQ